MKETIIKYMTCNHPSSPSENLLVEVVRPSIPLRIDHKILSICQVTIAN